MFKTAVVLTAACFLAGSWGSKLSPRAQTVFRDALANPGRYSDGEFEDAILSVPEIIQKYGYPSEAHKVQTSDGYILEMHRIPHGLNQEGSTDRPAILLMHGLLSSSADYIITGPGKAMGYVLADSGFDVWLGNARGNFYSRNHISRNPDSRAFWDFSWEEIGRFDLSAMVDYILDTTGQKQINYVGHSQGTTVFFVLNSMMPEYNAKFSSAHLMAPVAFMEHFPTESLAEMASLTTLIYNLGSLLSMNELFGRGEVMDYVDGEYKCKDNGIMTFLCEAMLPVFVQIDNPVLTGHFPAGASLKQVAHYGQNVDDVMFWRWNHGSLLNRLNYGQATPPIYDLSKVTCSIVLHYAEGDALVGIADVAAVSNILPNASSRRVARPDFSHFDFGWGVDAKELVYDFIVDYIHKLIDK